VRSIFPTVLAERTYNLSVMVPGMRPIYSPDVARVDTFVVVPVDVNAVPQELEHR